MEDKIKNIQSQVDSLQDRISDLETKLRFEENSKMYFKTSSNTQQDDSISNQNEAQNKTNFITLGKITEPDKIEIIKRGFQLNQQGKISLKKYYESKDTNSLFQWKGKYESIRRIKLYLLIKFD